MRKGILAIAAAGSVFALTAAGASGFSIGGNQNITAPSHSATTFSLGQCQETFSLHYNTDSTGITSVVATGDDTSAYCGGGTVASTLTLNAGTPIVGDHSTATGFDVWTFTPGSSFTTTGSGLTVAMDVTQ